VIGAGEVVIGFDHDYSNLDGERSLPTDSTLLRSSRRNVCLDRNTCILSIWPRPWESRSIVRPCISWYASSASRESSNSTKAKLQKRENLGIYNEI